MPNASIGSWSTANAIPTGMTTDKLPDWEKIVFMQLPEATPLLSLMTMFEDSQAKSQIIKWREHDWIPMTDTTNDATLGAETGATNMTVSNVERWKPGMQVINQRTQEHVGVSTVNYTTSVVYLNTRSLGTGAAAAGINDGDTWLLLQVGREELSSSIPCMTRVPTVYENYCQFMSDTMEMSWMELGRNPSTSLDNTSEWDFQTKLKIHEFKIRTELALFFNHKAEVSGTGNIRRYTGGLDEFLQSSPTNYDFGGNIMTWAEMRNALTTYQSRNVITSAELLMRPELAAEFTRMFSDTAMVTLDKLPSGLAYNVNQVTLGQTKYRIHTAETLRLADYHGIFVIDTSGNRKSDRALKLKYTQVGGGTEHNNGRIGWIDKQQNPDYSAKKSQLVAGMGLVVKGHSHGRFAKFENIAHA